MKHSVLTLLFLAGTGCGMAASGAALDTVESRGAEFLAAARGAGAHFEPNQGQLPADAQFCFRSIGYRMDLKSQGMELRLPGNEVLLGDPMRIQFSGSDGAVALTGVERLHFSVMHRPILGGIRRGLKPVPTYASVAAGGVYEGVDVRYHINEGRLEYDLVVAPGADAAVIELLMMGATALSLSDAGDLNIEFPVGRITQHKPHIYQEVEGEQAVIDGRYVLNSERRVGFEIGTYDPDLPLVIDPILTVDILEP